ncbi:MAG: hypothetical protein Q8L55_02830 [Phycisphaerales bacterium]|nr:hypothetical protein [Phycisphaerales bacterium]
MNDQNNNQPLPPELEALGARLDDLGASERACAPADLQSRILAATTGVIAHPAPTLRLTQQPAANRTGLVGQLRLRRIVWPMRVAAVIAVAIGGWAAFNGFNGPKPTQPSFNPDEVFDYVFGRSGTSEQIQRLLQDTANLESLVGSDDFGVPDMNYLESL